MQSDLPENLSANAAHCVWTGVHRLTKKASFNCKLQLSYIPFPYCTHFWWTYPIIRRQIAPSQPANRTIATCSRNVRTFCGQVHKIQASTANT